MLACEERLEYQKRGGSKLYPTKTIFLPCFALALAACNDPTPSASAAGADAGNAPSPSAPSSVAGVDGGHVPSLSVPSSSAPSPSASAAPSRPTLQILHLALTSEIKNKEPVDELLSAEPGQRVWAHLTVRNRTGDVRRIVLLFRVGGEERSRVELKVEPSWSFRTWGYNTLRAMDKTGELSLEIRDEEGTVLGRAKLPIKAASEKRASAK